MTWSAMAITGVPEFDIFFSLVFYMGMASVVPACILSLVRRG